MQRTSWWSPGPAIRSRRFPIGCLRWQREPTSGRLLAFFAVYALGFGNHLSMVLLMPAYTFFLLTAAFGRAVVRRSDAPPSLASK